MLTLAQSYNGLKIDWAEMPTYNTIMAVAAGVALVGLVLFARELLKDPAGANTDGWALNFGVLGLILTPTGLHMTLTWPLASGGFAFDNIIFGETSLAFGVLLLAVGFYLWRSGASLIEVDIVPRLARIARPISVFIAFLGLSLFAIAIAGVRYQLFAAPPEEPISGAFADYPLVEAIFISGLLAMIGIGALLFPYAAFKLSAPDRQQTAVVPIIGWLWGIAGVIFALFGALNFFTHIGLIINTM